MFHENWYTDSQITNLTHLVKQTASLSGDVIEIGCWEGKSTIALANACYPDTLICNDTWLGNIQESLVTGVEHTTQTILKTRDVYSIFLQNMDAQTKRNYTVVKRDCLEWMREYRGRIKFIHIDASHEYGSVFENIQLVLPHMVPGGIICGDDFITANAGRHDLQGGVERAVKEALPKFKNIENLWYYVVE